MPLIFRYGPWIVFLALLQACAKTDPAPLPSGPVLVEAQTVLVQPGSWARNFKSYGLVTPAEEYEIGRLLLEAKALEFGEGTSELHNKIIAEFMLGVRKQ